MISSQSTIKSGSNLLLLFRSVVPLPFYSALSSFSLSILFSPWVPLSLKIFPFPAALLPLSSLSLLLLHLFLVFHSQSFSWFSPIFLGQTEIELRQSARLDLCDVGLEQVSIIDTQLTEITMHISFSTCQMKY